jgi:regulator of sigma E protease
MSWLVVPLLVLGVIIVIHELGHFLVAKFFGIKVEAFSVGFGPRLIGFKYGDTDYRISAFPLGGYVKMSGENPGETMTGAPDEFSSKPKWQRFLVAAAGPAMNIALSLTLLTGLFMYGTEVPEFSEGDAIVGGVEKGSPAEAAGIQAGDRIVSIAGKERPKWEEVQARIATNANQNVQVVLNRSGKIVETTLIPVKQGRSEIGYDGMRPEIRVTNVVGSIMKDSAALAAGLQKGDEIIAVNGIDIKASGRGISEVVQTIPEETFPLTILRNGSTIEVPVTPKKDEGGRRMIGIGFSVPTIVVKESFGPALRRSIDQNIEYGTLVLHVLRGLVTRQVSVRTIDGPIGMVRATGEFYQAGFGPLLTLMAMISINLGLVNLLPIPILDGGLMLMLTIEGLMGHDLSMGLKERIVQVSFVFLLTLMVFVIYNDVVKILPSSQPGP